MIAVFFLLPLFLDHVFLCFAPSLVAAACVAASRLILHLSPTWPPRLQCLTGYTWENLVPCAEKMLMCVSVCCLLNKKITNAHLNVQEFILVALMQM